MARKKSRMVSEFGKSLEILERLSWAVEDAGGDDEVLRDALAFGEIRKRIGHLAVAHRRIHMEGVDHEIWNRGKSERTLTDMLGIETSVYVLSERGETEGAYVPMTYNIFSMKERMSTAEALDCLKAFGFRLSTNQEAFQVLVETEGYIVTKEKTLRLTGHVFTVSGGTPLHLEVTKPHPGKLNLAPRMEGSVLEKGDRVIAVRR